MEQESSVTYVPKPEDVPSTNEIKPKLWARGARVRHRRLEHLNYHQKQVSALAYYNSATYGLQRVLSAGLDGGVKVIDPVSFKVTYNFKFPDPLLAVAVSVGAGVRADG